MRDWSILHIQVPHVSQGPLLVLLIEYFIPGRDVSAIPCSSSQDRYRLGGYLPAECCDGSRRMGVWYLRGCCGCFLNRQVGGARTRRRYSGRWPISGFSTLYNLREAARIAVEEVFPITLSRSTLTHGRRARFPSRIDDVAWGLRSWVTTTEWHEKGPAKELHGRWSNRLQDWIRIAPALRAGSYEPWNFVCRVTVESFWNAECESECWMRMGRASGVVKR